MCRHVVRTELCTTSAFPNHFRLVCTREPQLTATFFSAVKPSITSSISFVCKYVRHHCSHTCRSGLERCARDPRRPLLAPTPRTRCLRYRHLCSRRPHLSMQGQRLGFKGISRWSSCKGSARLHGLGSPSISHRRHKGKLGSSAFLCQQSVRYMLYSQWQSHQCTGTQGLFGPRSVCAQAYQHR
jgi:hypothetical protein